MNYTVTITQSGQMTLPKALREFLGLDGAKRVVLDQRKNEVVIKRKITKEEFYNKVNKTLSPETREILTAESATGRPPIRDIMREITESLATQGHQENQYDK